ncbi:hypothetical protein GCM10010274_65370 [Streptomyces lavendofoliae]|uniref:Uncharacterized protein n=1 Tax=Streptomyces lavendofoliae TaxID=67314 RepID=A0A918I4Z4_9ACTN|nr:hypothetical protein GCM10010274_65370 [Streptomyces lavendofoliae]
MLDKGQTCQGVGQAGADGRCSDARRRTGRPRRSKGACDRLSDCHAPSANPGVISFGQLDETRVGTVATAHVVLGEVDAFPHTDCEPCSLAQSARSRASHSAPSRAAVLRERCLDFLLGFPHLPITVVGVIWQPNWKLPLGADYLAGIDRDMSRVGLRRRPDNLRALAPAPSAARPRT